MKITTMLRHASLLNQEGLHDSYCQIVIVPGQDVKRNYWVGRPLVPKVLQHVPLACLGSMAATVQPYSLGKSQKKVNKPSEQVAAPPRTPSHDN